LTKPFTQEGLVEAVNNYINVNISAT